MNISLRRRYALIVEDGAFSHKIDYVTIFKVILNLKGHLNHIAGSRVMAILLNEWISPIGGASVVKSLRLQPAQRACLVQCPGVMRSMNVCGEKDKFNV